MARRDRVVWLDRGWQPLHFGFCPSKSAWDREMKRLGVDEPYPDQSDARCVTFAKGEANDRCSVVVLHERFDERHAENPAAVVALLVHEATHVWQEVRAVMNDSGPPSSEFEAYSMQAIVQELYQAYLDTRIKP